MERLDKVISNQLCLTRTESRRLIKIGKVYVNSTRAKAFDTKVCETDEITVNGEMLTFQKQVYIMMNKPSGVVCDDKSSFPYAPHILPENLKRKDLFCVGRLDKDTTGLLLITNDGEYAHNVISPKKNIKKRYRATLDSPITDEGILAINKGLTLSDGTELLPAQIEIISSDRKSVDFIISEGKYHQIKRMAGAIDNKITSLERISIGKLELAQDLSIGQAKQIDKDIAFSIFEN